MIAMSVMYVHSIGLQFASDVQEDRTDRDAVYATHTPQVCCVTRVM